MATPKERMNKAYIESKLSSIFEPMVVQLIKDKPDEIVTFLFLFLIVRVHHKVPTKPLW